MHARAQRIALSLLRATKSFAFDLHVRDNAYVVELKFSPLFAVSLCVLNFNKQPNKT
jgi:hypothetical protein